MTMFDRTVLWARERPLSGDINRPQAQIDHTLREYARILHGKRTSAADSARNSAFTGFVGDGFLVRPASPTANMTCIVSAGLGFVYDPTTQGSIGGADAVDDLSHWKPVYLAADQGADGTLDVGSDGMGCN